MDRKVPNCFVKAIKKFLSSNQLALSQISEIKPIYIYIYMCVCVCVCVYVCMYVYIYVCVCVCVCVCVYVCVYKYVCMNARTLAMKNAPLVTTIGSDPITVLNIPMWFAVHVHKDRALGMLNQVCKERKELAVRLSAEMVYGIVMCFGIRQGWIAAPFTLDCRLLVSSRDAKYRREFPLAVPY